MWDYGLMYEIHLNVTGKIIRSSATGPLPLASKNCIIISHTYSNCTRADHMPRHYAASLHFVNSTLVLFEWFVLGTLFVGKVRIK